MSENYLTGIVKTDISDHFPVFLVTDTNVSKSERSRFVFKREINDVNLKKFNEKLLSVIWTNILNNMDPNSAYDNVLETFLLHYNIFFPTKKIHMKSKNLASPWITKGIIKSSKRKQKLYEKY